MEAGKKSGSFKSGLSSGKAWWASGLYISENPGGNSGLELYDKKLM
jgi:hypothetical protein